MKYIEFCENNCKGYQESKRCLCPNCKAYTEYANKQKKKIIVLRGCPASGKSTYTKSLPKEYVIISRDKLRESWNKYKFNDNRERYISEVEEFQIRSAVNHGFTPVIDDTNLNPDTQRWLEQLAKELNLYIEYIDFDIPYEEAVKRDFERKIRTGKFVGEHILKRFYNKYKPGYDTSFKLDPSTLRPFAEDSSDKFPCVICDLDGTIAIHTGRDVYDYSLVKEDKFDTRLGDILKMFIKNNVFVIFMSGRDDSCYDDTLEWLKTNFMDNEIEKLSGKDYNYKLVMRKTGDNRSDDITKKELYEKFVKPFFNVKCVFDDRNKVVDMWRSLGLLTCQVWYGNF